MSTSRQRAKDIALRALGGELDLLLACRDLAALRAQLADVDEQTMATFVGVASEVDGLPVGPERVHWAASALREKDIDGSDYRELVKDVVTDALRELLVALERPR